jgi:MarR family transcriptional regulator for hemolysin
MKVKGKTAWDPQSAPTFWINHASRLIMRRFEQGLRPLGFGVAYLPVVAAIDDDGELLQKDLAERAHVEQPTMAALLARMERDGLIAREPHPHDRRASLLALTAKAKAGLPLAKQRLTQDAAQAVAGLSAREQATLMALLRRVVQNLAEPPAAADGQRRGRR